MSKRFLSISQSPDKYQSFFSQDWDYFDWAEQRSRYSPILNIFKPIPTNAPSNKPIPLKELMANPAILFSAA
jgi:hypothetical protein